MDVCADGVDIWGFSRRVAVVGMCNGGVGKEVGLPFAAFICSLITSLLQSFLII